MGDVQGGRGSSSGAFKGKLADARGESLIAVSSMTREILQHMYQLAFTGVGAVTLTAVGLASMGIGAVLRWLGLR